MSSVFWRGFQAFFDAILTTFGWSSAATGAAVSLQRSESGLISPFVGTLLNRYGPRRVMAFGVAVTGAAFIFMSFMQSIWHFYLAIMLLTIGMSFGTFIVFVATVGNWFIRKRGKALALLMSASGLGGLTLPILVFAIDSFGWREVLFSVGIGFWIIGFPVALVLRSRPEDYGQLPDGDQPPPGGLAASATGGRRPLQEVNITVRNALRMRFFWQLAIASSLGQFVSATNLFHFRALKDFDLSIGLAATIAGAVAFGDLAGRIGIGALGERIDKRYLLGGAFALQTLGMLGLTLVNAEVWGVSFGTWGPSAMFMVGVGLGFGASVPLRLAILADYFGRRSFATMVGITSSVGAIFAATGPLFVGLMDDVYGGFRLPFAILTLSLVIAIPMSFGLESQSRVAARSRQIVRRARRRAPT